MKNDPCTFARFFDEVLEFQLGFSGYPKALEQCLHGSGVDQWNEDVIPGP